MSISRYFLFVLVMSLWGQGPAVAQSTKGIEAFSIGDYQQAANIWLVEAYEGSLDAQFNLGILYLEGKGVAQNREEAVYWFEQAASGGHVESQYNLGHLYFEDRENPESLAIGAEWWSKAARQGFPIAQFNYGRALFYGMGVPKNLFESRFWMRESSAGGEGAADRFLQKHADVYAGLAEADAQVNEQVAVQEETPEVETATTGQADSVQASDPMLAEILESGFAAADDSAVQIRNASSLEAAAFGEVSSDTLMRVTGREGDWLRVQVPGGLSGWVSEADAEIADSFVTVSRGDTPLYADKSATARGRVANMAAGSRLLLIGKEQGWYRVQLPESIAGWVDIGQTRAVAGSTVELAKLWQQQSLDRRSAVLRPQSVDSDLAQTLVFASSNESIIYLDPELYDQEMLELDVDEITVDDFVKVLE